MGSQTLTELRMGIPLRAGGVTIVPLEHWRVTVACDGRRVYANGAKRAEAIVVVDADGARALGPTGSPLDLEELRARVTGLREVL